MRLTFRTTFLWACVSFVAAASLMPSEVDARDLEGEEAQRALKEYISGIYEARRSLGSLSMTWDVRSAKNARFNELEDGMQKHEGVFDFRTGNYRAELAAEHPNDESLSRVCKVAFSEDTYRVMHRENLAGEERIGLGPNYRRDTSADTVYYMSSDVRLFGLLPERIALIKNYRLEDLLAYVSSSDGFTVATTSDGDERFEIRRYQGADCSVAILVDGQSGMPKQIDANLGGKRRHLVETSWKQCSRGDNSAAIIWFPKESRVRIWKDGDLMNDELLDVSDVAVEPVVNAEMFTWAAMRPPDEFVVVRRKDGKRIETIQWDKETQSFSKWIARPLFPTRVSELEDNRRFSWPLLINILVVIVLCAVTVWARRSGVAA
jgi:hypothetical protein